MYKTATKSNTYNDNKEIKSCFCSPTQFHPNIKLSCLKARTYEATLNVWYGSDDDNDGNNNNNNNVYSILRHGKVERYNSD